MTDERGAGHLPGSTTPRPPSTGRPSTALPSTKEF
jgi:hypothetical protein